MNDEDRIYTEEQEIEMANGAEPTEKKAKKKPAAVAKRPIEKAKKKPSKPKQPKERKPKKEKKPSERKRNSFTMTGERVALKIDDVFSKHLSKIANERDLPSIGHAADLVLGVGLTRMAALSRYNSKKT